jgi:3'(2'), 5'-bisphosphate nucleotidase
MNLGQLWDGLAEDLNREHRKFRGCLSDLNVSVKPDSTLLTDADLAIERLILEHIRRLDTDPVVVAEEDERHAIRAEILRRPGRIWVIDPIDGTAEFVKPAGREFCSVVCLLEDLEPVATFVFAPELGRGATPIRVIGDAGDSSIMVNGHAGARHAGGSWVSVTRSGGTEPRPFETELERAGHRLKVRTTSQTLDMVRTAVGIADLTDPPLPQFGLFLRMNQKVWDGLAGLCLGKIAGLACVDADGNDRVPVSLDLLSQPEPVFGSTIVGDGELVSWLLERM